MDDKTRQALLESIFLKWEGILSCKNGEDGSDDCPLCKLFVELDCAGCPVAEKAGLILCGDTPYDKWTIKAPRYKKIGNRWLGDPPISTVVDSAVEEQEFLISLLSKKDQDNLEKLYIDFIANKKRRF